jgi:molybdopterin converting factor small subunit
MIVGIRYFASLADRTRCRTESIEVDGDLQVSGLWRLLVDRHPGLTDVGFRPLVACDREYSDWDRKLEGVLEVAFLPPVSGG